MGPGKHARRLPFAVERAQIMIVPMKANLALPTRTAIAFLTAHAAVHRAAAAPSAGFLTFAWERLNVIRYPAAAAAVVEDVGQGGHPIGGVGPVAAFGRMEDSFFGVGIIWYGRSDPWIAAAAAAAAVFIAAYGFASAGGSRGIALFVRVDAWYVGRPSFDLAFDFAVACACARR